MQRIAIVLALALAAAACSSTDDSANVKPEPEAWSLSGEPLYPMELEAEDRARKEAQLSEAEAALAANPEGVDEMIWVGRRLAYLGRFNQAIDVFSHAIDVHPKDARLFRHRGHRYITLRQFDQALADLERAAELVKGRIDEIEPPGLPNARGIALDTLNQNVYYHLGLAHYLRGDFERAGAAFRLCLEFSKNPDSLCSATHWLFMTLSRLGRDAEAKELLQPIRANFDIVEYHAYHQLCLVYKGEVDADEILAKAAMGMAGRVDFVTIAYGVGNWHLYHERTERAVEIFRRAAKAEIWPAFGRIAAEVELARIEPSTASGDAAPRAPAGAAPSSPTP